MSLYAVTLDDDAVTSVERGAPNLVLSRLPNAASLEPGRPVRLLDSRGGHVACGVADPENDCLRVYTREAVSGFDVGFFRSRVKDALALREALDLRTPNAAYRLVNAEGDGLGGFTADAFGPYGVVYAYSRGLVTLGRVLAQALIDVCGLEGVVLKVRPKGGVKPGQLKQEIIGKEPPESFIVDELGSRYEVHLKGGLNVGLFTDMREHRRHVSRFVQNRRVLNTFAYTGAISVAAARAGAREVTSVDISSGVLKWAMTNFKLSGLDPNSPAYKFEVSDVVRFMEKARDQKVRYDTIVMDPPTFSAARAHSWSMRNDYPDLIALACELLPEDTGGFLWVSSNEHGGRGVQKHIEEGVKKARRSCRVLELGGLPPDYPSALLWSEGRYLEVCQVWISSL